MRRHPAASAPVIFGGLLPGTMTLVVAAISTVRALGLEKATIGDWLGGFASSWVVTLPSVLI